MHRAGVDHHRIPRPREASRG